MGAVATNYLGLGQTLTRRTRDGTRLFAVEAQKDWAKVHAHLCHAVLAGALCKGAAEKAFHGEREYSVGKERPSDK